MSAHAHSAKSRVVSFADLKSTELSRHFVVFLLVEAELDLSDKSIYKIDTCEL
jgi:hypothetical protein